MAEVLIEKAEEIFYTALNLKSPVERRAYWERACQGNTELRTLVEQLLASQAAADALFPEGGPAQVSMVELSQSLAQLQGFPVGPATSLSDAEEVGKTIGLYKLLQRLGEGGCGVVYMAEQEKPVRRRVALKIIKLGMDTKSVIARFEAERQALAMMDHPNIARVLDAGATQTGRPFFVMELVHGVRITEYCDANSFDTRQRLELFIQVCSAIQHAHQKGIIHRDIKPSNILVTMLDGKAVPKVIDFGVAKAIEEKLTDKTLFTMYGYVIGTPAYMSPEQAQMSGMDVDTRSDIYSLGVLLYELLTGRTPFDQKELVASGIDEMRRTLREREPHRPSAKLDSLPKTELTFTAQRRHVEPLKLRSDLRGDLDWIVMTALEKDRQRRYQTVNALAADIRRHLNDEAVTARPPSRAYRFRKLVRRNKTVFAAVGAIAFTLVCGLGTSTWLYLRERETSREHQKLRRAAERAQHEAEAREKATAAAVFLGRNDFERADQLIGSISEELMPASLESLSLLRSMGAWHAARNEWRLAADRYMTLQRIIVPAESTDAVRASGDLLPAAALLMEQRDLTRFERLRSAALERFGHTAKELVAERVLKACLLAPADEKLLRSLSPLARVATNFLNGPKPDEALSAWQVVALGLYEYRGGRYSEAVDWTRKYSTFNNYHPARSALAHGILAMSYKHLGEVRFARAELARTRELIGTRTKRGWEVGDWNEGYWYDWIIARVVMREAESLMESEERAPGTDTK